MRRFQDAGIPVESRHLWGGDRNVIRTNDVNDQARVVWSLIDRDHCLIVERPGFKDIEEKQTVFPTRYWHRLLVSGYRRIHVMRFVVVWSLFVSVPLVPLVLIKLTPGQSVDAWNGLAAFAYWIIALAVIRQRLRDEPELMDARAIFSRLAFGLTAGGVWSALTGVPDMLTILGGTWVFIIANLLFIGSIGYDRYVFEYDLRSVGGRLPTSVADQRLSEWSDRRV